MDSLNKPPPLSSSENLNSFSVYKCFGPMYILSACAFNRHDELLPTHFYIKWFWALNRVVSSHIQFFLPDFSGIRLKNLLNYRRRTNACMMNSFKVSCPDARPSSSRHGWHPKHTSECIENLFYQLTQIITMLVGASNIIFEILFSFYSSL